MIEPIQSIVTVTLNPTIDRVMEVPGFHVGAHAKGRVISRHPAGKAVNVSRVLAQLEVQNTAAGFVGFGNQSMFDAYGRTHAFATRFIEVQGLTRENTTIIDTQRKTETHLREEGPRITASELEQLAEVLKELGDSGVLFVFTGSCPPGLEAGDFEKLLSDCQTSGARLAIDTSGEPLRRAAKLPPYLIKPNLLELGELLGRGLTEHEEAIEEGRKLAASIPVVVVTLGAGGAYCFTDGKVWGGQTRLPAERIRSTVGCGDTFLAAFLAGLLEKDGTPETALAKALAISGASAMTQGPGEFTSELVREAERVTEVAAFD